MSAQNTWEKIVDKIFSLDKKILYLLGITLLALVLRIIASINLTVSADDMHFVTHAIGFLQSDKLITWGGSSGLWFAFTDIMYGIFGYTQLASRLASIIFGTLSVIVLFFLTKEFFKDKIAYIAAFLLAISPFNVLYTVAEIDVMAMFFVLLGMLFFVKATKSNKTIQFVFAGISIGLAVYTKVYPLLFIPSLLLFYIYIKKKNKDKIITKSSIKKIMIFLFFIFIFTIPALTHNYLLYKDKGFMDLQFTRTLGLGKNVSAQYYSWDAQFDRSNSWKGLILGDTNYASSGRPLLLVTLDFIRVGDPIVFYLGALGLISLLFFKRKNRIYPIFFIFSIIFAWPFLASIIVLQKHFMFMDILLIPLSAFFLNSIINSSSKKIKNSRNYIILLVLVLSLLLLGTPAIKGFYQPNSHHFYGTSHIQQLISFKEDNIQKNSLMVLDDRIYTGRSHWVAQGRPYLGATTFIEILQNQGQIEGDFILTDVYFIECVPDDCGWGTIKNNPALNLSMEELTKLFKENGDIEAKIYEPIEKKPYYPILSTENKEKIINIHHSKIQLKSSSLIPAFQPKDWFLYDIGYTKSEQFDSYETHNFLDDSLNTVAHFIVNLALFLSFLLILFTIYLTFKK